MRLSSFSALALFAVALGACTPRAAETRPSPAPAYDIIITGARIVDGTGSPWYYGDVAIRGDRIADVAPKLPRGGAQQVIDATGMVVSPGFIDMLGHSETSILRNRTAISKVTQGITSEITGEVSSVWPNTVAGAESQNLRWTSLAGYFDVLEDTGVGINLGTFLGAASIRRAVMGDASRSATAEEIAQMGELVEQGMRDGAMGVGAGLIYPPTTWFTTQELISLVRHAARYGGGYSTHMRSESDSLLEAIHEALTIAGGADTWLQIHHLKAAQERNWGKMRPAVAMIDSARKAGQDVSVDMYPYIAAGTGLDAILPTWVQAGGNDSMLVRLQDPAVRERLRNGREQGEWGNLERPETILVTGFSEDSLSVYEGRNLKEIGEMRGQNPYEAAYDLLVLDRARASAIYFAMSEEDVAYGLQQPWVSIGQDAGARTPTPGGLSHPRAFGSFPRVLGHYVRETGVLQLEDAIRKMTSLPAGRVGLADRGVLKRGMYADVVVFDPATVKDEATFTDSQRLSSGINWVFVNGTAVVANGVPTEATPGRALRGPGAPR